MTGVGGGWHISPKPFYFTRDRGDPGERCHAGEMSGVVQAVGTGLESDPRPPIPSWLLPTAAYLRTELSFMAMAVEPFTFSLPVMKAMVGSSLPAWIA